MLRQIAPSGELWHLIGDAFGRAAASPRTASPHPRETVEAAEVSLGSKADRLSTTSAR